jgi:hypothetical protein
VRDKSVAAGYGMINRALLVVLLAIVACGGLILAFRHSTAPVATFSISPKTVTIASGGTQQFSFSGTGSTDFAVTWSASCGTVSSTGLYEAPSRAAICTVTGANQSSPPKSASATVTVAPPGIFTLQSQQPVTSQYYPQSIFNQPLPGDVGRYVVPNSDAIVFDMFGGNISNAATMVITTSPTTVMGINGHAFYYAFASDPVYTVTSCSHPPASTANNPVGKFFHLTNRAQFSSQSSDQFLEVWDQSSDIDPAPGGRILSFYAFTSNSEPHVQALGDCSCTTPSCASTKLSCQIHARYCEYGYPQLDTQVWGHGSGAYASAHFVGTVALVRGQEIIQDTINHALLLNDQCNLNQYVFPSQGLTSACSDDKPHPSNGSLFFIDSGYNCKTLPAWQEPFCRAMQTYGGYIVDTGGTGPTGGLHATRIENGVAYTLAGLTDPLFAFLAAQSGNGLRCSGNPVNKCTFPTFNMPGLLGPPIHLHMVDPCIPEQMAGRAGACSAFRSRRAR